MLWDNAWGIYNKTCKLIENFAKMHQINRNNFSSLVKIVNFASGLVISNDHNFLDTRQVSLR